MKVSHYLKQLAIINGDCEKIRYRQLELMEQILDDNNGSIGGLIAKVNGHNGTYDVESAYIEHEENGSKHIMVCLAYPAFGVDVEFRWLTNEEQNTIIEQTLATLTAINS